MIDQYLRLKADHPDAILLFHLGDFYEAFFEDAEILAREVEIVLTARNGNPMAGVPLRRGEAYVNQLLKKGYKVAICRQVEDSRQATGLVKREVVRVVTPGTTLDDGTLEAGENNHLCAIYPASRPGRFGLATLDLSTGESSCTEAGDATAMIGEIARLAPHEILLPEGADEGLQGSLPPVVITFLPAETFNANQIEREGFGLSEEALCAAGAILAYVEKTQKGSVSHIRPLQGYLLSERMDLDPFTVASLELIKPLHEGQEQGTLLHVLDSTVTSMGRRRLRRSILAPSTDRAVVEARLDAVEALTREDLLQQELQGALKEVHDLERLAGKLGTRRMRPLDLLLLQKTLERIPSIPEKLAPVVESSSLLGEVHKILQDEAVVPLCERLNGMLVEQPPVDARDGGLIRQGYSEELDRLRDEARTLRSQIAMLERREREATGISSLKVGYNRVFGYYIEVTKTHLDKVPAEYHRRQTLANAERFITEELNGYEERIVLVQEHAKALELDLFEAALDRFTEEIPLLQRIADALAQLDLFLALAVVARQNAYVRPQFTAAHAIMIRAGRHPVAERITEFVPNDLSLDKGRDLVILTGPNMSGKSIYLRQTALILLMAQIGSFVPATEAILPIIDRVFARVGASDMLVSGVSTFMMEMLEVATILERASARSLVILDEMGRGTSTFDGVSIAWAVAHELATRVRAKTLFATHYQELTRLADEVPAVVNLHVAVKELGKQVVFLHRVEPGTAAGSYGVHVARLAGLPSRVTETADRILAELLSEAPLSRLGKNDSRVEEIPLFGTDDHPVLKKLRRLDPDQITPVEALVLLAQLKDNL
ncbi:DNA mismatch repair protein MutS [Candidatus Bipolaricaulota bacterium]|nr:DNA mismatch repair protein MutS [Candidatus Bipolaricaulota bacterium]